MSRPPAAPALLATLAAAFAFVFFVPAASAATVTNGDFEAGGLEGWQLEQHFEDPGLGGWSAFGGAMAPISNEPVEAPFGGSYSALADDSEPASMILYQDVSLAAGETHQLSLELSYSSNVPASNVPFVTPSPNSLELMTTEDPGEPVQQNQQVRVDVTKASSPIASLAPGEILATLFETEEGDSEDMPWTRLEADLTPFAGQTVRIRIAVVASVYTLNAGVDDVAIASSPVPGPPNPEAGPSSGPAATAGPAAAQSSPISLATAIAPKCVAPKLKGLGLKAAKQSIRAAGCGVGHVGRRKGVPAASGTVVRQTPTPGTSRPPGAKIAIKLG